MDAQQIVSPAAPVRPSSREAGFSIIEGLIAALLLLIVTLGILPLFSRAMNNNIKGNDSTRQANGAADSFETYAGLFFNSGDMTVQPNTTQTVVRETMALEQIAAPTGGAVMALSRRWVPTASVVAPDVPVMNRVATLQQYAFDDFDLDQNFEHPLGGEVEARLVHLKVLDVVLQDASGVSPKTYRLRAIRAF